MNVRFYFSLSKRSLSLLEGSKKGVDKLKEEGTIF
jgi:hypothetical protein